MDRVAAHVARAEAAFASGDAAERDVRALHPLARYRDPHPVFDLSGALLRWALEDGASEVSLVATPEWLRVSFGVDGRSREVVTVPSALQEPLLERLKDCAMMDVTRRDVPQEGIMYAVRSEAPGVVYDVRVSLRPSADGESAELRISQRPDGEEPAIRVTPPAGWPS